MRNYSCSAAMTEQEIIVEYLKLTSGRDVDAAIANALTGFIRRARESRPINSAYDLYEWVFDEDEPELLDSLPLSSRSMPRSSPRR